MLLFWEGDSYTGEDEAYYICIDIATAEMKAVTVSDPEKVYFGMIGAWESPGTTAKWKKSEGAKADPEKKASGSLSVQEQLACISRHASVWLGDQETDEIPMEYFAVTDLDYNGRLEVIASTDAQGSGGFTCSEFYQVSADGTGLRHISGELQEDDIVEGIKTAYVDTKNHLYYYCTEDYVSAGAGSRVCSYGALVLKNGMLTRRAYAGMESVWNAKGTDEEWHYYRFRNGNKKEISPKKFDQNQLADEFFDGFQKKSVNIAWFQIRSKKKLTEEQIKKKLTKSYQDFR